MGAAAGVPGGACCQIPGSANGYGSTRFMNTTDLSRQDSTVAILVALCKVFSVETQKAEPPLSDWMGMSFDQQGDEEHQLDEAATAIMLRRLPSKLMIDSFLEILNQFWPGRYNFVYVPHDKSRARNVALAFVNFTDSESARMAYAYFQGRTRPMDTRLGRHIRVCQADIQGLNLNLAYFIARSGFSDMSNPHAPRVFENGRRIDLLESAKKHVTMQLVAQANQHTKAVDDARGEKRGTEARLSQRCHCATCATSSRTACLAYRPRG